eukprot:CAMPEP_0180436846 /NCGR_PEP_ID=MMETSP1036_2-20121128/11234_1 /TAXON_ID=632150 /ORGANISM="Azadinium spinosum, Strain 3D9" /LENGTH=123 /DNA_ID=CAMNT_0022442869 /DNA_START=605 /DNA_END=976 /DNA_ORIENTATION=-
MSLALFPSTRILYVPAPSAMFANCAFWPQCEALSSANNSIPMLSSKMRKTVGKELEHVSNVNVPGARFSKTCTRSGEAFPYKLIELAVEPVVVGFEELHWRFTAAVHDIDNARGNWANCATVN